MSDGYSIVIIRRAITEAVIVEMTIVNAANNLDINAHGIASLWIRNRYCGRCGIDLDQLLCGFDIPTCVSNFYDEKILTIRQHTAVVCTVPLQHRRPWTDWLLLIDS